MTRNEQIEAALDGLTEEELRKVRDYALSLIGRRERRETHDKTGSRRARGAAHRGAEESALSTVADDEE